MQIVVEHMEHTKRKTSEVSYLLPLIHVSIAVAEL